MSLTPFACVATRLGWEEKEVLKRIESFIRRGWIRRLGAVLRHQKAGYLGNAMVVWKVPEDRIPGVARAMIAFPQVSHCYLRSAPPSWSFNLYTMVHGRRPQDCRLIARTISRETGLKEYRLLFSKREHKKSSMRYFERGRRSTAENAKSPENQSRLSKKTKLQGKNDDRVKSQNWDGKVKSSRCQARKT